MSIILAFLPFIVFALLQDRLGSPNALLATTAVAAVLVARQVVVLKKSPKILECGSLVLFALLAAVTRLPQVHLGLVAVKLCVDVGLFAIVIGSLAVGKPFTLQYAREQVSAEIAQNPLFLAVNIKITAAWALAFAVIVAAELAVLYVPGVTLTLGTVANIVALVGAAAYTAWLPKAVAARAARQSAQAA
jgi:hypothetical protein